MRILPSNENGRTLREMLNSGELQYIMEVHDGLSAKIVDEAGFKAMWLSGLSLSATNGVRDNCELTVSQVGDFIKFVTNAVPHKPLLIDADNLYADFNAARIAANLYEQMGAAGIVVEDKAGRKTNSLMDSGTAQPLADPSEFIGKLNAARESVSKDFVIIARLESFITGHDAEHAFDRACQYAESGVDAILVHSKKPDSRDIDAFMQLWLKSEYASVPIVIVPTKYYSVPVEHFKEIGATNIIWANHMMRACVSAMQDAAKKIFEANSLIPVEENIASVSEVFRLQNDKELKEAEKRFIPTSQSHQNAIILAASKGGNFDDYDKPKCCIKVNGKSLIRRQVEQLKAVGISNITVVVGYNPEAVKEELKDFKINYIENPEWSRTKDLYSLSLAKNCLRADTIILFGDIHFNSYILENLINNKDGKFTAVVDIAHQGDFLPYKGDIVRFTEEYSVVNPVPSILTNIETSRAINKHEGEFIGMWKVGHTDEDVQNAYTELGLYWGLDATTNDMLFDLMHKTEIEAQFIFGNWFDVDSICDLI